MKNIVFLLLVFASALVAEEINPEVKKIDERLDELRTIYRQEEAVINGYTKNRTVPVREGSKEYLACLEASKRIKQAEAEAKELKEKRRVLLDGGTPGEPVAEVGKGPMRNENFAVVAKKVPSIPYAREKHGPKIKDLFLGMSMTDCADKMKELMETPYRITVALQDAPLIIAIMQTGVPPSIPIPKGNHLILPAALGLGVMTQEHLMGLAGENGEVGMIMISGGIAKELFKAHTLKIEDFVENFSEAYEVDLEIELSDDGETIKYRGVTKEGVAVFVFSDFSVTLGKGVRPEETKKAFD